MIAILYSPHVKQFDNTCQKASFTITITESELSHLHTEIPTYSNLEFYTSLYIPMYAVAVFIL